MVRQPSGAMICPNCNKLISVSEERCPFCGAWRPGMFGMTPALRQQVAATVGHAANHARKSEGVRTYERSITRTLNPLHGTTTVR